MTEYRGQDSSVSETIYALASGPGTAGVALIRVSGPSAKTTLEKLTDQSQLRPRHATLTKISRPKTGILLDMALVIWFPEPHSFTGEDVVEYHLHGGRAVVSAVMEELSAMSGVRVADPGEFSRRAFINEKMDLTEAEGLADLIAAETEMQRIQAIRQLQGSLSDVYEEWRCRLFRNLAHIEAVLDFSDEELPVGLSEALSAEVALLAKEISTHLDDENRGQRLRDGISVAIVGAPNVGKSSLLNWLAKRDVAIVHDRSGTTRDVLEVQLDLCGFPVLISDTAGLRESHDAVEIEGIRRGKMAAEASDIVVAVYDASNASRIDPEYLLAGRPGLLLMNKTDLNAVKIPPSIKGHPVLGVSCRTGVGLEKFSEELGRRVEEIMAAGGGGAIITRQRHRESLIACVKALGRFSETHALELRAEELRHASNALGRITGRVDVEDILGLIFSEFCIGK